MAFETVTMNTCDVLVRYAGAMGDIESVCYSPLCTVQYIYNYMYIHSEYSFRCGTTY